jgi:hypothetical protein
VSTTLDPSIKKLDEEDEKAPALAVEKWYLGGPPLISQLLAANRRGLPRRLWLALL